MTKVQQPASLAEILRADHSVPMGMMGQAPRRRASNRAGEARPDQARKFSQNGKNPDQARKFSANPENPPRLVRATKKSPSPGSLASESCTQHGVSSRARGSTDDDG